MLECGLIYQGVASDEPLFCMPDQTNFLQPGKNVLAAISALALRVQGLDRRVEGVRGVGLCTEHGE